MANLLHFATCNGQIVTLSHIRHVDGRTIKPRAFSGICPACSELHVVERRIERKANPSNHKCSDRCRSAKGHQCECECGGKNHGSNA